MKQTKALKQPIGEPSCVAYVAAMATDTTPEAFKAFCADFVLKPKPVPPYDDIHFYAYLLSLGWVAGYSFATNGYFQLDKGPIDKLTFNANLPVLNQPAFVVVEGPIDKTVDHAIYWDGEQIYDPHHGVRNGRHPSSYRIKQWVPIYRFDEAAT